MKETVEEVSYQDIKEFTDRKDLLHLVGMLFPPRPGVRAFNVLLEYTHYAPGTDKNDNFIMHVLTWGDVNMRWSITSVPIDDKHLVEECVGSAGLRIADGVPTMFSPDGSVLTFPADGSTVFTLENTKGHAVYKGKYNVDILEAETRFIDEFFEEVKSKKL